MIIIQKSDALGNCNPEKNHRAFAKEISPIEGIYASKRAAGLERMRMLKFTSTILGALCLFELGAILFLASRQTVSIPYVIEIARDGTARYVDNASTTLSEWNPSIATTLKTLERYIVSLRGVSNDPQVQQERIRTVYAYSTEDALKTAQDFLLESNPLERGERERVEAEVYAATPFANGGENLYQLDWNEKTYSLAGALKAEANFRAVMNIRRFEPATKGMQEANPLGIYVTRLDISQIRDGYAIRSEGM